MTNLKEDFVELGSCKRPHGIKGGFSFHLYNYETSILKKGMTLKLFPLDQTSSLNPSGEDFDIQNITLGKKTICYLKNIQNINQVEEILPFKILVKRSLFPDTEEGEYYLTDLIGCKVLSQEGKDLGIVTALSDNGMQDILIIDDDLEVLLIDNFVLDIDIEKKVITISLPEFI